MTSIATWEFHEQHFSSARLRLYSSSCAGDHDRATSLYRWNVETSGAFWESLAYLEVALRNSLNARMEARQQALGRTTHWVYDDARELGRGPSGADRHRYPYKDVAEGIRRVRRNQKQLSPGQVISEVPFGFWHQLVSRKQTFLWPDLAGAFPHAPNRSQETIQKPVGRLRDFRNRLGHHHRVWSENVPARYDDLLVLASYIDPALQTFIDERSRVPRLLADLELF